ncbi:MAG: peptidylprolyl isomerase [Candidatus Thermoplasmatota archaeon]|nr:peptidylprolyl isomerase [Candidatus Thermoplasmatota archaeon]
MRASNVYGASNMTPFFILLLGALIIIAGAVLNFTLFTKDDLPPDNGVFLDEEIITYGEPYAVIQVRNYGDIVIKLEESKAPQTVDNFKNLANKGFYDGLIFHRVIQDFMIQGGDPSGDGSGGPGYTIPPETNNGLKHDKGAISMAKRSGDERMSGSQFFIVQGESGAHHLDGEHTVFGYVVEGMDIVDAIARTQVDSNDKPINTIIMEKVYVYYE